CERTGTGHAVACEEVDLVRARQLAAAERVPEIEVEEGARGGAPAERAVHGGRQQHVDLHRRRDVQLEEQQAGAQQNPSGLRIVGGNGRAAERYVDDAAHRVRLARAAVRRHLQHDLGGGGLHFRGRLGGQERRRAALALRRRRRARGGGGDGGGG